MGKVRACSPMPVVKVKGRDVTGNRATSDVVTRAIVPNYPPISQARTAYGVLPQFINRVLIPSEIDDIRRYNEDRERPISGSWKLHKDQTSARLKAHK